ncbi:MAG: hypothetical protein WD066_01520 [Planctomycetaceae bacterium]
MRRRGRDRRGPAPVPRDAARRLAPPVDGRARTAGAEAAGTAGSAASSEHARAHSAPQSAGASTGGAFRRRFATGRFATRCVSRRGSGTPTGLGTRLAATPAIALFQSVQQAGQELSQGIGGIAAGGRRVPSSLRPVLRPILRPEPIDSASTSIGSPLAWAGFATATRREVPALFP